jgi:hypothetical protein
MRRMFNLAHDLSDELTLGHVLFLRKNFMSKI